MMKTEESGRGPARARRVLLIGWDAADWKMIHPLVEQGQMPNMARLINEGMIGNVASLTPMLSPMLWTSIATGKTADKHNILGFCEPDVTTGSVRPVTSTSRQCKAIWNILSDRGLRAGAINWFASHPAEAIEGFVVTDRFPHASGAPDSWPTVPRSVHPESLLDHLAAMRVHPAMTTREQVAAFVPFISEVDPAEDALIRTLRSLLAQCGTVQAVSTALMQDEPWEFCGVYFDTIDRMAHAFMEFHPPRMSHVSDRDFRLYRDVMVTCYKFHDMMLGRMLEIAGDECVTMVLSDHGFHCDHLRPDGSAKIQDGQPVAWHRTHGVLAIHGPGIRKDERLYGASLLDITPTVLALLGQPVADDMDGSPLVQIFEERVRPSDLPRIETYEDESDALNEPEHDEEDPWVLQQMMQQLQDLGYVTDEDNDAAVIDRARNLAQVHLSAGRPREAMAELDAATALKPNDPGMRMLRAQCHLAMNELDEAESLSLEVLKDEVDGARANFQLGVIAARRGDLEEALDRLTRATSIDPNHAGFQCEVGQVLLRLARWEDAERTFRHALEIDSDAAEAHDGLGVALRAQKRPGEAVEHHMRAASLMHYRPRTHVNLGLALAEVGRVNWAIRAFNVAIEMAPEQPFPHRCLAELYGRVKKDEEMATFHQQRADELAAQASES